MTSRTDSNPDVMAPPSLEELNEFISAWIDVHCQSGEYKTASQLDAGLRTSGAFSDKMAARFWRALAARLAFIVRVTEILAENQGQDSSPQCVAWSRWAAPISQCRGDSGEWDLAVLAAETLDGENGLMPACIAQSLEEAVRENDAIATHARKLSKADAGPWTGFPLPPAKGRSLDWEDYLRREDHPELFERGMEMVNALSACVDELDLDAECLEAQHALKGLLRFGASGWPLERSALAVSAQALRDRLESWPLREEQNRPIRSLVDQLNEFVAGLAEDGGASENPEEGESAGFSSALRDAIAGLQQAGDPAARELADRLRTLIDASEDDHSGDAAQRQLLCSLVELDQAMAQPGPRPPWMQPAQAKLQRLLLAGGRYILLDRQLVGRPLASCHELAEPAGLIQAKLPPQHVARIVQPGYARTGPGGAQEVLQRAKVLLSR